MIHETQTSTNSAEELSNVPSSETLEDRRIRLRSHFAHLAEMGLEEVEEDEEV